MNDYYNNRVDVRGHKYVFGPTQNHFSPSVARVKMRPEEGQKHIYAPEHQLYCYYNNFEGLLPFNFNFVFQINWLLRQWAKMYFSPLICSF